MSSSIHSLLSIDLCEFCSRVTLSISAGADSATTIEELVVLVKVPQHPPRDSAVDSAADSLLTALLMLLLTVLLTVLTAPLLCCLKRY